MLEELYRIRHKTVTVKSQIRHLPCLPLSKIRQLFPACLVSLCWLLYNTAGVWTVTKCCRILYNCSIMVSYVVMLLLTWVSLDMIVAARSHQHYCYHSNNSINISAPSMIIMSHQHSPFVASSVINAGCWPVRKNCSLEWISW